MQQLSLMDDEEKPPGSPSGSVVEEQQRGMVRPRALSPRSESFLREFFPEATINDWNNWHWQLRNRIKDFSSLSRIIQLSAEEKAQLSSHSMPLSITPYYTSLLDRWNPDDPLRKTVVPVSEENNILPEEMVDPLGEHSNSPCDSLVHRYPDRVLFLVTDFCSTYCRYCTRSRLVGRRLDTFLWRERWERALSYIETHTEIRDVLISGGDPLTLSEEKLFWLLNRLRKISHVEVIRIGTKAPVVLPQRITPVLTSMLKMFHPLWMSIHFTHPKELTPETIEACNQIADAGIPMLSQTVLLAGVNDNVEVLKRLFHGLLKIRVKPYYLYQCDPVPGTSHFRTPVEKGLEIVSSLQGFTSGFAVPNFVIDVPGGGGKIPLFPNRILGRDGNCLILNNFEEKQLRYPDITTPCKN